MRKWGHESKRAGENATFHTPDRGEQLQARGGSQQRSREREQIAMHAGDLVDKKEEATRWPRASSDNIQVKKTQIVERLR
jgi:hypothetical protein